MYWSINSIPNRLMGLWMGSLPVSTSPYLSHLDLLFCQKLLPTNQAGSSWAWFGSCALDRSSFAPFTFFYRCLSNRLSISFIIACWLVVKVCSKLANIWAILTLVLTFVVCSQSALHVSRLSINFFTIGISWNRCFCLLSGGFFRSHWIFQKDRATSP